MREIYLDTAATTKPDPQVLVDFVKYSEMYPYNPSSIYKGGVEARQALEAARKKIADCVGCETDEIFFTSGGTEGNNMIIRGFFEKLPKNETGVLITSQIEHPSVLRVAEGLETKNSRDHIRVYYLPVDEFGLVSPDTLANTIDAELNEGIDPENILVSIQEANNEIGIVQSLDELSDICFERGGWLHSDAVQHFPHYKENTYLYDSFTVSGHKFGALKGTGFIYICQGLQKHISPLLLGGHQEIDMRAGTENIAGFIALANRVEVLCNKSRPRKMWSTLHDFVNVALFGELNKKKIEFYVNGIADIPVYSLIFPGVDATALISLLSENGIYISAGSACHSYNPEPSHVLKAIGLSDEDAKSTVRICWNPEVTREEWDYFCEKLVFYIKLLKGE